MSTEPVYAYRSYAVFPSNLIHCNSNDAALVPLFYRFTDVNGESTESPIHGTAELTPVDLFDWSRADDTPEIGDPDNWCRSWLPKPHDEFINTIDEGTEKGYYSFKTIDLAVEYIRNMNWKPTVLFAKIQLAGVVVEHENGYRAEMTRIVELFSDLSESSRDLLAERLGWPFGITAI